MASTKEAAAGDRSWLRSVYWAASIIGPIVTALAFMDIAAHGGSPQESPMIGLEGNGAPNALPFLFIAIAFVCVSSALVSRSLIPEPRPTLPGAVSLSVLLFILTGLVSRPLFHAKWERDCDRGVGRACWAIATLTTDPARKAELLARACDHGDARGCEVPAASASSSASATSGGATSAAPPAVVSSP